MAGEESNLSKIECTVHSNSSRAAPATLLAPAALVASIQQRAGARGMGGYLRYLLSRYRSEFESSSYSGQLPDRTLYQSAGLQLTRLSLRPFWGDWLELSVLARALGCSRCRLFVLLCELDLDRARGHSPTDGVPTDPNRQLLYQEAASLVLTEQIFPGRRRHARSLEIRRDERLFIELFHGPLAASKYELTGVLDLNYSFNFHEFWPNFRRGERP